ncbi:uncharacterized protein LOC118194566 [Stegodyphus dumicola]|uniref:uncharacterized protein LOC118194566 n=1 Tax=Stegodyphus dumicola TaxID=202533 RepID=UPI0015ACBAFC|nr:uncharacterized protein LOC118194566 [Stegodyphus dumicola]
MFTGGKHLKMNAFWVFLVASAVAVAYSEDDEQDSEIVMNIKDVEAIQEELNRLDFLEKVLFSLIPSGAPKTEQRDDKCIPIGGECAFWSGPNCCGLRTRCHVMGKKVSPMSKHKPAVYRNICDEYRLGVWLDDAGKWFKNTFG